MSFESLLKKVDSSGTTERQDVYLYLESAGAINGKLYS